VYHNFPNFVAVFYLPLVFIVISTALLKKIATEDALEQILR